MKLTKFEQSWGAGSVFIRSLPVGIIVFVAVLITTAVVDTAMASNEIANDLVLSDMSLSRLVFDIFILSVFISPFLETFIFSIAGWALLRGFGIFWTLVFAFVVAGVAWWLHGADQAALNRALGFFLLALWYRKTAREAGTKLAFLGTAVAHATWNLTSVSLWFVGQIFSN